MGRYDSVLQYIQILNILQCILHGFKKHSNIYNHAPIIITNINNSITQLLYKNFIHKVEEPLSILSLIHT